MLASRWLLRELAVMRFWLGTLPSSACRAVGQMERGGGSDREEHAGSFAHLGRGSGARGRSPLREGALNGLHGIAREPYSRGRRREFRPTARITPTMRQ